MEKRRSENAAELDLDAIIRELELDVGRPLIELCAEVLDEYGYVYVPKGDNELRFTIQTTDRAFRSQIIVNEAPHNVVRLWVYPDVHFINLSKAGLAEFVCRLNQSIALGGFGLAWDEDALFFRNGVHCDQGDQLCVIEDLLSVTAFPLSLFHLASRFIIEKTASPQAAVEAAAVQLEVADWSDVSSAAKKLLIHAVA